MNHVLTHVGMLLRCLDIMDILRIAKLTLEMLKSCKKEVENTLFLLIFLLFLLFFLPFLSIFQTFSLLFLPISCGSSGRGVSLSNFFIMSCNSIVKTSINGYNYSLYYFIVSINQATYLSLHVFPTCIFLVVRLKQRRDKKS